MSLKQRILLEIFFLVVIYFAYQNEGFDVSREELFTYVISFFILYVHGMINRFFILPFLTARKKYIQFFALSIAWMMVCAYAQYRVELNFVAKFNPDLVKYITILSSVKQCLLSLFVMSAMEFVVQQAQQEKYKTNNKLLLQQLESANLKAQLNPHFLFNSLNNAYGISLNEPARAPEYILSLAQLMRYQLESTKHEQVLLQQEIDFVKNYVALEKERIGKRCDIGFDCSISDAQQHALTIMPMVFMAFVENAVKHGTASIDKSFININLSGAGNTIDCVIENSVPQHKTQVQSTGTGLINIQKRLQLVYPEKHTLSVSNTSSTYKVSISITLSNAK
jgi:two-component system, LytTR family, sensor kinase